MYAREGLVYWIVDKQGNKVGVPIKASSIYSKPTLKALEEKFKLNEQLRKPYKAGLIQKIDEALAKPQTKLSFIKALAEQQIKVILRQNGEGRIYGVTFIDQQNKAVFNGSDLGKAYSANLLSAKFLPEPQKAAYNQNTTASNIETESGNDLLDILLASEQEDMGALNKIKRESKKKRKGLNL